MGCPIEVTVIVATFGDEWWYEKGCWAAASALAQGATTIQVHDDSLAVARNIGAARADTEWLCFLDADDVILPGYFDAMAAATGDLRAPAVQYDDDEPMVLADRNINVTNPCVIGTLIRKDMFMRAGGFWEEEAWEDWSLFRRCWLLGATIEHVPGAVYHVAVNPRGRNGTVRNPRELHAQIRQSHKRWLRGR